MLEIEKERYRRRSEFRVFLSHRILSSKSSQVKSSHVKMIRHTTERHAPHHNDNEKEEGRRSLNRKAAKEEEEEEEEGGGGGGGGARKNR